MGKHSDRKDQDAREGSGGTPIQANPIVGSVICDPDTPVPTVHVLGYIGSAGTGRDMYCRIYLDMSFRNYYEVLAGDIHYAQPPDPTDLEKPSHIYVKAHATLLLVKTVGGRVICKAQLRQRIRLVARNIALTH